MVKVKMLTTIDWLLEGKLTHLHAGSTVDLPLQLAISWVSINAAQFIDDLGDTPADLASAQQSMSAALKVAETAMLKRPIIRPIPQVTRKVVAVKPVELVVPVPVFPSAPVIEVTPVVPPIVEVKPNAETNITPGN
jgi:hypothetical protein